MPACCRVIHLSAHQRLRPDGTEATGLMPGISADGYAIAGSTRSLRIELGSAIPLLHLQVSVWISATASSALALNHTQPKPCTWSELEPYATYPQISAFVATGFMPGTSIVKTRTEKPIAGSTRSLRIESSHAMPCHAMPYHGACSFSKRPPCQPTRL
jgi:hypothetical protein